MAAPPPPREPETAAVFEVEPGLPAGKAPELEGVNACRAASLSPLLSGRNHLAFELSPEFEQLGTPPDLERPWEEPQLGQLDLDFDDDIARQRYWNDLHQGLFPLAAYGFLIHLLASELPRERTAAAAVLWRDLSTRPPTDVGRTYPPFAEPGLAVDWRQGGVVDEDDRSWAADFPRRYSDLVQASNTQVAVLLLAQRCLMLASTSPDPITRELGAAAFLPATEADPSTNDAAIDPVDSVVDDQVSVLVHGTRAWAGDWWRARKRDFHAFVDSTLRRNPYAGGAHFSWNGALSDVDRTVAAEDLVDWASDRAPTGLWAAFAHSYGGEVVCKAVNVGMPLDELVLLSVPVNKHVKNAVLTGLRVVDVRLKFDPVLTIANCHQRVKQRLPKAANVTEVRLGSKKWRWSHGATHEESVWLAEDIRTKGGF
jgi:hypothetical protein